MPGILYGRILQFSKPDKGDYEKEDLHRVLDNVVKIVEKQFNFKGITIERNYCSLSPYAMVNVKQIQEVILNILNNSSDAIIDKGQIEISTSMDQRKIYISIVDNGCGIKDGDLEKIYEPFFQHKK